MTLSIVTTMYRSAPYLREFYDRVCRAAASLTDDLEIIFVNDGCPDNSLDVALDLMQSDQRIRVIDLSRNFGHHKAMMTGLEHARGDVVFLIDCDLEEPPEVLGEFYSKLRENHADVVYGVQDVRRGTAMERLSGRMFYKLFNWLSDYPIPENVLTVRLMSRRYVRSLVRHKEKMLSSIAGLWQMTGFKQVAIVVGKRRKGRSSYALARKLAYAIYAVTAFSNKPLLSIGYMGVFMTIPSGGMMIWLLIRYFIFGINVSGYTSVVVSLWFIGGLIIFTLGIIGIYLATVFVETKDRPYTIIREMYGRSQEQLQPTEVGEEARRQSK